MQVVPKGNLEEITRKGGSAKGRREDRGKSGSTGYWTSGRNGKTGRNIIRSDEKKMEGGESGMYKEDETQEWSERATTSRR